MVKIVLFILFSIVAVINDANATVLNTSNSSGNLVYCYREQPELYYQPTTRRCEPGDYQISRREHDSRGLFALGQEVSLVWCFTPINNRIFPASELFCQSDRFEERERYKVTVNPGSVWNKLWCATPRTVFEIGYPELVDHCRIEGKAYSNKSEAVNEHRRLKAGWKEISTEAYSDINSTAYCFDGKGYYFGPYRDPFRNGCASADEEVSLHEYIHGWNSFFYTAPRLSSAGKAYCYDTFYKSFYRSATSKCSAVNKRISEQEFLKKRLFQAVSTSNPSTLVKQTENMWCATKYSITRCTKEFCDAEGGETYWYKYQAEAEHKRLKVASASTASSSKKLWCASRFVPPYQTTKVSCKKKGYDSFGRKAYALARHHYLKAEHKRLKAASAFSALSSGSEMVWCAMPESSGGGIEQTTESTCRYSGGYWSSKSKTNSQQEKAESKHLNNSSEWKYVWCATELTWLKTNKNTCDSHRGKSYTSEYQAKAEHKRLKAASTSTASNSSGYVWCATEHWAIRNSEFNCNYWDGKAFSSRNQAEAEHKRMMASSSGTEKTWCATKWDVYPATKSSCDEWNGKTLSSKYQAEAEHRRLKEASTSTYSVMASSSSGYAWCVTKHQVTRTNNISNCLHYGGKTFPSKQKAKAEYERLNATSSSLASATGSKKVWCVQPSGVRSTTKTLCNRDRGQHYLIFLEAKREYERLKRLTAAIDLAKKEAEIGEHLDKLIATKSCRNCVLSEVDLRKADLRGANLFQADLTGANLSMADLSGANLTGAILREADLTGTDLSNATLRRADLSMAHVSPRFLNVFPTNLRWADLSGATLIGANLLGVDLTGVNLTSANLTRANLLKADLGDADLSSALLIETSLIEANLDHADLTDAILTGANLTGACLDRTNLSRADLTEALLGRASFDQANLNGANLHGSRLKMADLSGIDLRGADLGGANLTRADLAGTGLAGTNLNHANLYEANLTGADLSRANLENVNLIRARLRIADLRWATLSGAELDGAKLVSADLTGSNLAGASLIRTDLSRANLSQANLNNADLSRADLSRAALIESDLVGTTFYRAELDRADLSSADLTGADMTDASSSKTILDRAIFCRTIMPNRVQENSGCKKNKQEEPAKLPVDSTPGQTSESL